MRIIKWKSRHQFKAFLISMCYLVLMIVFLLMVHVGIPYLVKPSGAYVSEGSAVETEKNFPKSEIAYNYYLDISPSMRGFFNTDGSMENLAQVFQTINNLRSNKMFYYCGTDIVNSAESSFYNFMADVSEMDSYYMQELYQAGGMDSLEGTDTEPGIAAYPEGDSRTPETEGSLFADFNLSDVFTKQYDNNREFVNNENTINIIISDLNFMESATDYAHHNEYLEQFARSLSGNVGNCNVGIYRIMSSFVGYAYDDYEPDDKTEQTGGSFFLIVFSPNDLIYDAYVTDLEREFETKGISADDQYEIKNDRMENIHEKQADPTLMSSQNLTSRFDHFNRNSKYFENVDEYAIGLQIVKDDSNTSYVQIPVMQVELSGYYGEEETEMSNIDVRYRLLDAGVFGYRECITDSGIHSCTGNLLRQNGKWYLYLNLEIDQDLNGAIQGVFKRYCVVDIWFSLKTAGYSLPQWVQEINASESATSFSQKLNIQSLFEMISDNKMKKYEEVIDDYQKQIGNVRVYISY